MIKRKCFSLLALLGLTLQLSSQHYKELMHDPSVNFYDVVRSAEQHFQTVGKGKGSGWKGFERWRNENEGKFYPDGIRSNASHYLAKEAYRQLDKTRPTNSSRGSGTGNAWKDLGPYDANNITRHYAPGIGRVEAIWVDPNDTLRLYLGSRSGGFWRSTDGGASWKVSTDTLIASGVNTIAVSPSSHDSILINVRNASNGASHGIYRSIDAGNSWTMTPFNPTNIGWGGFGTNNGINKIVYHPTVPNLVFIGAFNGLYRSSDNLATYTQLMGGNISDIEFHPTDADIIYAYSKSSPNKDVVLRSMDRGLSFTASSTLAGNSGQEGFLSTSTVCPNCLWVGSKNGVWISRDTAANFTFKVNPASSCRGFAVSDLDTNIMVYGYVDLEASSDGGKTFNQVTWWSTGNINHNYNKNYVHADLRCMESVNGVFYCGTDGYMCKSTDGGISWKRLSDGTGIRENYRVGVSQNNCYVNMCGSQDNGTSILNEQGWIEWNGGDGMEAVILPLNEDLQIGSWQYGGRNRTFDGGQSREAVTHGGEKDWVAPMVFDPNDQLSVYSFGDVVFKSTEWGSNWVQLDSSRMGKIKHAAIAENNSNIILINRNDDLAISTDGALSFTDISSKLPNGNAVADINFDPKDDSTVIICYNRHQDENKRMYISHDLCNSWTNISYNLSPMPVRSVVIDHGKEPYIYAGGEVGVYYMAIGDTTWTLYNKDLARTSVNELEIQYATNTLRAATWGRGLWEVKLKNRENHPSIVRTAISNPPDLNNPKFGKQQYVSSVISYQNTLTDVYLLWSADSNTLDNRIKMSNTVDSNWVSDVPLPNFPEGTKMFFRVYAIGSNLDSTETYRFQYTVQPFVYCDATASTGTGSDYINRVSLNGVTQNSGKEFYADFTNVNIPLTKRSSYTLEVELNFAFGPDTAQAWIDYNGDAEFNDSEKIEMSSFAGNVATGNFFVPDFNGMPDTTTMRVRNAYGGAPRPCGTIAGEVEDYTIVLNPSCHTEDSLLISTCASYLSPSGKIINSSGSFTDTLINHLGCDSLIDIDLTVVTIDRNINLSSTTLTSNETAGNYQWLDCRNDTTISGATSVAFSPSYPGSYAVAIDKNGCQDTSLCVPFSPIGSGIRSVVSKEIVLYPNPTDGAFVIEFEDPQESVEVEVSNPLGQFISSSTHHSIKRIPLSIEGAAGLYFIHIRSGEKRSTIKLIKEGQGR